MSSVVAFLFGLIDFVCDCFCEFRVQLAIRLAVAARLCFQSTCLLIRKSNAVTLNPRKQALNLIEQIREI